MHVATLIAPKGALDPALAESLRDAWGGGKIAWLSPDEAAEFPLDAAPDNRRDVWQKLRERRVDLAVQRAGNRRRKMLLADMDGTVIRQEGIDELAREAGVGDRVGEITARAMNGELDFEEALIARVALLKNLPETALDRAARRLEFAPGGHALVATMKANGAWCALVSGGFTALAAPVAAELGFDEYRANALMTANGVLTGEVAFPILGRAAKAQALEEIAGRRGIGAAETIAVGDGANDLDMLGQAGAGVALRAKPGVAAQCDMRIDHGDLSALLYLQGYSRDEFV